MKTLKHLLTALLLMVATVAMAHDFEEGGIYYNILSEEEKTVEVTYRGDSYSSYSNEYTGSVDIPSSVISNGITYAVTSIGWSAFEDCTGLTSITIPNSVTSIGYRAFYGCSGLKEVYISDLASWCNIDFNYYESNPLYCAHNLYLNGELVTELVIPDGVSEIKNYAFYGYSGLTSIKIPNSVTSIGSRAFYGCSGLEEVHISDLASWCNIDFNYYESNPLYYAHNLYLNGELVTELVIPDGVSEIKNYAFSGCKGLTSVTIPNSVTSIGGYAFYGCSGLTSVTIPNSVTSIGGYAFYGCSGLTSVTIPNSVTSIGDRAFYGTAWYNNLPDGVVYAGKVLYKYKGLMPENTNITIKEGTLGIADYAFGNCSGLTSITIPNSVTSIGSSAFCYCSGLTSVTIGNSVTSIGGSAFSGCTGLTSITIPNSVTRIGSSAFDGCSGLISITIPNSVTSIGVYAFYGCSGLTSVTIPNSVTSIGYSAFYGCSGLTSITIPNSVTSIGEEAFYGCFGLTSITIPNSVTSIEDDTFYKCSGLTSITIPNSVTSIGDYAFYGCTNILEIKVGSKNAITCSENIFSEDVYNNALLCVPEGRKLAYEKTAPWNRFYIVETDYTDINGVKEQIVENNTVYDLQGRKVENPTNGIYIVNGKKVFVK